MTIRVVSPEGKELFVQNDKVLISSLAYIQSDIYDSSGTITLSAPTDLKGIIAIEFSIYVKAQTYDVGKIIKITNFKGEGNGINGMDIMTHVGAC